MTGFLRGVWRRIPGRGSAPCQGSLVWVPGRTGCFYSGNLAFKLFSASLFDFLSSDILTFSLPFSQFTSPCPHSPFTLHSPCHLPGSWADSGWVYHGFGPLTISTEEWTAISPLPEFSLGAQGPPLCLPCAPVCQRPKWVPLSPVLRRDWPGAGFLHCSRLRSLFPCF